MAAPEGRGARRLAGGALGEVRRQRGRVRALRRLGDDVVSARFESRLGPEFGERIAAVSAPALQAYARLARLRVAPEGPQAPAGR